MWCAGFRRAIGHFEFKSTTRWVHSEPLFNWTRLASPQICIPLQHQLLRILLHAARQARFSKLSDHHEIESNPLVGWHCCQISQLFDFHVE